MKKQTLSGIMKEKVEGVIPTTYKGSKKRFLVRVKVKNHIVTVTSFKKEEDAEKHYKDIVDGKIDINFTWK